MISIRIMTAIGEFETIWKQHFMVYFKVMIQHLSRGTKEATRTFFKIAEI